MNKNDNIERGEFFKFQATVTRRNGKFYLVTWSGVRGVQGSGCTNRLEDNIENLYKVKNQIINSLKIQFEIGFEGAVFREKSKEQLEKITKKNCYEEYLLTSNDHAQGDMAREKMEMEKMLKEVEMIKMRLK